jgi:hypothetical protein
MTMMRETTRFRMVLALGLVGCAGSAPPVAQPEPETSATTQSAPQAAAPADSAEPVAAKPATTSQAKPDVPPPGSPLDRIMKAHFQDALLIRQAVIQGNPARASEPAAVFKDLQDDLDKLPKGWRGFVERMQEAARRVTDSTSSAQAAAAAADLGVSCGMCHQAHGGPKASGEPIPPEGTTIASRMKRHVWAADRLWEGLFVPSEGAWNAGAKALSAAPFPNEVLKAGGVHARSAASEFAKLVSQAPAKKTSNERAALYAQMLVTCGACHVAAKGGS